MKRLVRYPFSILVDLYVKLIFTTGVKVISHQAAWKLILMARRSQIQDLRRHIYGI